MGGGVKGSCTRFNPGATDSGDPGVSRAISPVRLLWQGARQADPRESMADPRRGRWRIGRRPGCAATAEAAMADGGPAPSRSASAPASSRESVGPSQYAVAATRAIAEAEVAAAREARLHPRPAAVGGGQIFAAGAAAWMLPLGSGHVPRQAHRRCRHTRPAAQQPTDR